jgi:hypothetical protein
MRTTEAKRMSAGNIQVPPFDRVMGSMVHRAPAFWSKLGAWESRYLGRQLETIAIAKPIFIAGLARAGSTVLLEFLDAFPETASHRYRDFPLIFTPYWWNRFIELSPGRQSAPSERAHKDRIKVSPESPEAMEEPLWSAFFPKVHSRREETHVLDASSRDAHFDAFYQDHIRKVLLVRGGSRYLAKSNYSVTRLQYLHSVFPDARFVIPIRAPLSHVASLAKQHALFCAASEENRAVREHLRNVGHFEFGPDRQAVNTGDFTRVREIESHWARGEEALGLAKYWSLIYRFVWEKLADDPALREASIIIRYEDLCHSTHATIRRLIDHCELKPRAEIIGDYVNRFTPPTYYKPVFSDEERAQIRSLTRDVAELYGY